VRIQKVASLVVDYLFVYASLAFYACTSRKSLFPNYVSVNLLH